MKKMLACCIDFVCDATLIIGIYSIGFMATVAYLNLYH